MTIEAIPSAAGEEYAAESAGELVRLGAILVAQGFLDHRSLDRARRVSAETGGRLDRVLTQLGMVSERSLADALAQLVGAPVVHAGDYPEEPLYFDRLKPKFLRKAHALPIAENTEGVTVAMADPTLAFAEVVREYVRCWEERDLDGLLAMLRKDVVFTRVRTPLGRRYWFRTSGLCSLKALRRDSGPASLPEAHPPSSTFAHLLRCCRKLDSKALKSAVQRRVLQVRTEVFDGRRPRLPGLDYNDTEA